ncbi:hypothetical protein IP84_06400 [beta proteobacterium AAP99]|nr:hypothetical protein IP84_06400 [beta proteobacterium AAP99]
MRIRHSLHAAGLTALALSSALLAPQASAAPALPQLNIDPAEVSVSGLSSGGFMAVQMHVAYSATFRRGAGVVAGGPYFCAEGSITNATGRCMQRSTAIPVSSLVSTTRTWAGNGSIDPVDNLSASRVYLFSGSIDSTVKQAVMNDLQTYYASFVPAANTVYKKDIAAEHAMITDDYGNSCSTKASPYISDCNFDLAGEILKHLYGTLNARNNGALGGSFTEFDQSLYVRNNGMAATGWVYVPQSCAAGASCRLHVVFHGCQQNTATIGDNYVRNTGYNRWADTNNIVLLYPQTGTGATNGCWDWWGYNSADYARKSGPQMAGVRAMITRLASGGGTTPPPASLPAPTGVVTSGATSSSMLISWNAVSGASGYNVYRAGTKVNASRVSGNSYTDTGLAAATTYSWTVKAVDANGAEGAASAAASGTTTGSTAVCFTATNYAHVSAGRATQSGGYAYAKGSGQNMGLWNVFVTTTLKQTGPDYYVIGTCP